MAKPPNTPPSSDIDGIDEDEVRNTDAAVEADQDTADLARAQEESIGRPEHSDERSGDDRSR